MSAALFREATRHCSHLHQPWLESRTIIYSSMPHHQPTTVAASTASASPFLLSRRQPCTGHFTFQLFFSKVRDSVVSAPLPHVSSPSASSRPKKGILGWYLGMIEAYPIVTKSITAGTIFAAADLSSQMITNTSSDSIDLIRTLRMAGYGMLLLGPILHLWFNFISKVLPKRDVLSTLKKIFIGQTVFGPIMTSIFFSVNAGLQGENGAEIISRLKRDLLPTMRTGIVYWPLADYITFRFIPVHLQPVICNSFSFFWTIYLTHMATLKKASSDKISTPSTSSGPSIDYLRNLESKQGKHEKAWLG